MMGVGFMELLVIALVAIIVLGPGKAIDMARSAGKMVGEVRRSFTDLSSTLEPSKWEDVSEARPKGDDSSEPGDGRQKKEPESDGKAQG